MTHLKVEHLDLSLEKRPSLGEKPSLKKLALTSWKTSTDEKEGIINHTKHHRKLMKPLQINHKRELATVSANKQAENGAEDQSDQLYDDLLKKVSELTKISKLHDKYLKGKSKPDKKGKVNNDNNVLLKAGLSQDACKYIEMVRELNSTQTEATVKTPNGSNTEARSGSLDREIKPEEKQKRLATQLSNQVDKKVPKQLNSNAHFRHAKRKILLLRALDSVVNHKEAIKDFFSGVNSCREFRGTNNKLEEVTPKDHQPRSELGVKIYPQFKETVDTPASKFALENGQYFLSTRSAYDPSVQETSCFDSTTPRTANPVYLCDPQSSMGMTTFNIALTPGGPNNVSLSHFFRENGGQNNTQDIDREYSQMGRLEKEENHLGASTLAAIKEDFKGRFNSINSKSQFYSSEDEMSLNGRNAITGRSNKIKQKIIIEYKEKKANRLKCELKLNLLDNTTNLDTLLSSKKAKEIRALSLQKVDRIAKHIRRDSQSFSTLPKSDRAKPTKTVKISMKRGKLATAATDSRLPNSSGSIQELIQKSFKPELQEKIPEKETEVILNSYGFVDSPRLLKKSKGKPRFLPLEGYQAEFYKNSIAKIDRHIERMKKREKARNTIL